MEMFHVGLNHFLGLSAMIFGIGLYGVITRKNELSWLTGILFMFISVNTGLVAFSRFQVSGNGGQVFPAFIIIIISAQIAAAALVILRFYRRKQN